MVKVTVNVIKPRPDSVHCRLERHLGRKPTNAECREAIFAIARGETNWMATTVKWQ